MIAGGPRRMSCNETPTMLDFGGFVAILVLLSRCAYQKVDLSTNWLVRLMIRKLGSAKSFCPPGHRGRAPWADWIRRMASVLASITRGRTGGRGCSRFGTCLGSRCASGRRRSGRTPFVAMMEATDLRDRDDCAIAGWHDSTMNRWVFVQR